MYLNRPRSAAVPIQARAYESDLSFVQKVLDGDEAAACDLRRKHQPKISAILCARGATKSEAEDLIADVWSECFGGRSKQPSLLTKYGGRCSLESWLITVATNRFIALRRRERFRQQPSDSQSNLDNLPAASSSDSETALTELLLHCVRKAFSQCDLETLLMLKLVHIYDITQREIGQMWRWHESKVCRALNLARREIKTRVLAEAKQADPWLKIRWDDFVQLCAGLPISGMQELLDNVQVPEARQSKEEGAQEDRFSGTRK